ncbi:hypothetical protein TPB0596_20600 [Tsukamurella pulmonis]|uniref:winged helix-turn-helix transcriptional regulator n=1 Tax=Tsukamurella pulmonis TaxID=47312 RepID=UPI001EDF0C3B|nr:helix-turn-helix domain-containing protein [Tsukamurella pulmonis]BDD82297.1 hypothetical protein TPB0596_20600 [Tsukamurella pulmonis]
MNPTELPSFDSRCPMRSFPIQIGGRWTAMIIRCLAQRPCRFGELRRHLTPISAKALSETLHVMEEQGYVRRRPFDEGVTYHLTDHGRSLVPIFDASRTWAARHLPEYPDHRG